MISDQPNCQRNVLTHLKGSAVKIVLSIRNIYNTNSHRKVMCFLLSVKAIETADNRNHKNNDVQRNILKHTYGEIRDGVRLTMGLERMNRQFSRLFYTISLDKLPFGSH